MNARARELAALDEGAYARRLALRASVHDDGTTRVELPFADQLLNRGGRIHGGAIASVALAAGRLAAAASEHDASPRSPWCAGANIAFLRVPSDDTVTAVASVLQRGRDLAHVGVEVLDANATRVASAMLTCVLRADDEATPAPRSTATLGGGRCSSNETISASPYLSAAGVELLEPVGRVGGLRLPFAPNAAERPRRIDDGAIAGLVDSCAAFASYLDDGASFGRSGVTVSMMLSIHAGAESDAFGHAVVLSRSGSSRVAQVEVSEVASGLLLASGMAVYRIVPE